MDNTVILFKILNVFLLQLQLYKKKQVFEKKKKKSRIIWARKWLERRNCGRGLSNLVFKELAVEDTKSFKNFTRMSTTTFEILLCKIGPIINRQDTIFRECISAKTRLLITLRYLATGESFQSLHFGFRISVPAISKIIPETVKAICEVLQKEYLSTPKSEQEWRQIAATFYKLWNFPNCLGALDGKHIAFRAKKTRFLFLQL